MAQWIAFDEESTAAVAAQTQMAVLFQRGDALDAALSSGRPGIVMLPSARPGEVLLLKLQFNSHASANTEPIGYQATGLLGLIDEPIFADDPATQKKKWWQRLLD